MLFVYSQEGRNYLEQISGTPHGAAVTPFTVQQSLEKPEEHLRQTPHVGVFRDGNNPHSLFLADEFTGIFEDAGGWVELVSLEQRRGDHSAEVLGRKEKGVELLYLLIDAEVVVAIEKETRKLSWEPKVMVSDGVLSSLRLEFEHDLSLVEGMLAAEVYSTQLPETEYGRKVIRVFDAIREKGNQPGTVFTGLGCEGTSILLSAMDHCGEKPDRSCINRMLRSTEDFMGLAGRIRVRVDGKTKRPIFVNTIEDHKLKFVVKNY